MAAADPVKVVVPLKITVTEDVKVPPVLMAKLLASDKVRSAPALAITGPLTVNKPPIENGEVFAVRDPVLLTVTVPAVLKPALAVRKPLYGVRGRHGKRCGSCL